MDISRTCYTCGGDGLVEHGESGTRTCYSCHGAGTSDEGNIANGSSTLDERLTDIEDTLNTIITKLVAIWNKLNE